MVGGENVRKETHSPRDGNIDHCIEVALYGAGVGAHDDSVQSAEQLANDEACLQTPTKTTKEKEFVSPFVIRPFPKVGPRNTNNVHELTFYVLHRTHFMLTFVRIVTRTITCESSVQVDREPTFYVLHRTHSRLTFVRIVTRTITCESSVQSRNIVTYTVLFAAKRSPQVDREPTFYVLHRTHSMVTLILSEL